MIIPRGTETNLSYLMNILGVSGRELSRTLHVDPSLVSKWMNHRRKLRYPSPSAHSTRIAEHLLTLCSPRQLETIRGLLEQGFPAIDLRDRQSLTACLADWLTGFSKPEGGHAADGNALSLQAFKGVEGRRQAVTRFLDSVLSSPDRLQLLLLSQEDMAWLVGDPSYLAQWSEKLRKILQQGHRITIIHTVDRKLEELVSILEKWLALHLMGGIESYYYPKYTDHSLKNTLFIIPGRLAVTSLIDEQQADTWYTFLHQDPRMVRYYEGLFTAFRRDSQTFLKRHAPSDWRELRELRREAATRKGSVYHIGHLPSLDTLPWEILESAIAAAGVWSGTHGGVLGAEPAGVFQQSPGSGSFRGVYSVQALERAASGEDYTHHGAAVYGMEPLKLRREHLRGHLAGLIRMVQDNPNYEVALVESQPPVISRLYDVWVKENALATFVAPGDSGASGDSAAPGDSGASGDSADPGVPDAPENAPLVLSADEITTVNAFYRYCDSLWQSIPRVNRDREWVAARLRRILTDHM